jgi:Fe-S oxidoreductase
MTETAAAQASLASPTADAYGERLASVTPADAERVAGTFLSRLDGRAAAYLNACVRCGLCADTCHYPRTDGEPASLPARKLGLLASVYRRARTATGRLAPALTGARALTPDGVREWVDAFFGRCTLCGRCALNCSVGIELAALFASARGALTAEGYLPPDLAAAIRNHRETGNSMGVTREDWVETVEWLTEELRQEPGCEDACLPLDRRGAGILYAVNPREAKFFPLSLVAAGKIFHAAGESWTLSSDLPDLTNYGLFSGDPALAAPLAAKLAAIMQDLGTARLVIGECGHGFVSNRWGRRGGSAAATASRC